MANLFTREEIVEILHCIDNKILNFETPHKEDICTFYGNPDLYSDLSLSDKQSYGKKIVPLLSQVVSCLVNTNSEQFQTFQTYTIGKFCGSPVSDNDIITTVTLQTAHEEMGKTPNDNDEL